MPPRGSPIPAPIALHKLTKELVECDPQLGRLAAVARGHLSRGELVEALSTVAVMVRRRAHPGDPGYSAQMTPQKCR
jgi:hypothetical protein